MRVRVRNIAAMIVMAVFFVASAASAAAQEGTGPVGPPLDVEVVQGVGSVEVAWREPADNGGPAPTGYRVRWRDDDEEEDPWQPSAEGVTLEETARSHEITGLERSHYPRRGNGYLPLVRKSYDIEVAADTPSGPGEWASRNSGELQGVSAPGEPQNLSVSGDGELVVTWEAPSEAGGRVQRPFDSRETNRPPDPKIASFYVRWREAAGGGQAGSWQRAGGSSDLGHLVNRCVERTTGHNANGPVIKRTCTTTYAVTGLEDGTAYEVQVRTLNDIGVVSVWAEPPPTLFLSATGGGEIPEAGQSVQVTAALNAPAPAGGVEVTLAPRQDDPGTARPDIDYSLPAAFTIAEGQWKGSATVTILDDAVNERDETINLIAAGAAGAVEVIGATIVIEDDESHVTPPGGQWNRYGMLVTNVSTVSEYRSLTFTFDPNPDYNPRYDSFWLQWRADDNPEWTTVQGIRSPYTLNLPRGANDILHHVRLIAIDSVNHGWVTVSATPTLQGPEPQNASDITLSVVESPVSENAGRVKVRATLYHPAPPGDGATVALTPAGGDAVLDADYSLTAAVEIPGGFRQGSAFIEIIDNAVNEAHKTIELTGRAGKSTVTAAPLTITIRDDEPDYGDPEGNQWMNPPRNLRITPGDGTVRAEFDPPEGGANAGSAEYWMQWRADDNPLWTTVRGGYIRRGGKTHHSDWTISGLDNGKLHHVRVAHTRGQGQPGLKTWSGWVTAATMPNDPGTLTLSVDRQTVDEDTGTVTVTAAAVLDRPALAGGVKVSLTAGEGSIATAGADFVLPDEFVISEGNTVHKVEITIINDRIDESEETVVLEASTNPGLTVTGTTFTITDNDEAGVTVTASPPMQVTEAEGDGHAASYTVALNSQPTADVTVTPISDDPTAVVVGAELTFGTENWDQPQTVTVTAVDDEDKTHETLSIAHAVTSDDPNYDGITPSNGVVGVKTTDDDLPTITFEYGGQTVDETDAELQHSFRLWIRNLGSGDNALDVRLGVSQSSTASKHSSACSDGIDYFLSGDYLPLRFHGSHERFVTVWGLRICGDDLQESDETIVLHLVAQPDQFTILGTGETVITIKDDDGVGGL